MSGATCPSCGKEWPFDHPELELACKTAAPAWEGTKEFCCWGHLEQWARDKRVDQERVAAVRAEATNDEGASQ